MKCLMSWLRAVPRGQTERIVSCGERSPSLQSDAFGEALVGTTGTLRGEGPIPEERDLSAKRSSCADIRAVLVGLASEAEE